MKKILIAILVIGSISSFATGNGLSEKKCIKAGIEERMGDLADKLDSTKFDSLSNLKHYDADETLEIEGCPQTKVLKSTELDFVVLELGQGISLGYGENKKSFCMYKEINFAPEQNKYIFCEK